MKKHVNNFFFNKKAAIFLDRDGIINKDYGYVYEVKNFDFVEDIFELLRYLKNKYLLFIVTNQSGIGRGLYSEKDFLKLNDFMIKKFNQYKRFYTALTDQMTIVIAENPTQSL